MGSIYIIIHGGPPGLACRPLKASVVPDEVGGVSSPLYIYIVASEWEAVLAGREFAVFVVRGIREIFLDYRRSLGGKSPKNMRWTNVTPDPINRYVRAELQQSSASPAQPPYE